ncbi:uncharacterized protein At4g06744-like [Malania oleifera]|uniref:uncharacterized protein At4g06744-like n=1 Tax=Malania oleifera TaxID=397392 RepID=UPI0025ADF419|nr:uncharacterized protein At4g06744-like [Malania oleifera]
MTSRPISFLPPFLLFSFLLHSSFNHYSANSHYPNPSINNNIPQPQNREALLEIIIGGGAASPPSPSPAVDCPPPPPQPLCPPPISPPPPPPPPPALPPPALPPPPPPALPPPPPPALPPPPPPSSFDSVLVERAYRVIQKFKPRIKHDPQHILKTWTGPDVCNRYKGFHCDRVPDKKVAAVSGVSFNGFGFAGDGDLTLDGFIEGLEDIAFFHANSNNFTGSVPVKTKDLRYLYELDLSNNRLSGEFPTILFGAKKLVILDLRFNAFSGVVPPQIFALDVDVLFINNNNFVQKLPDEIGSTPAVYLTLANNKFTGEIPRSIGKASKTLLEVLFLNNQLGGCLPYEIGFLEKATVFDVGQNRLTGPIPLSFSCLRKMKYLNLAQNEFYGPVPEAVCGLPSLVNFSLADNYFTEVGPKCRVLIEKRKLDVRMNCILGLPSQRTKYECTEFFRKPRRCPDDKEYSIIPCSGRPYTEEEASAPPALPPRTYGTLMPHGK